MGQEASKAPKAAAFDDAMVQRLKAGDPHAFALLFRAHRGMVWRVLQHLLHGDPEIEDVVQATFLEVHRAIGSFEGRAKLSSWITRIALHVGYRHLRHKKSRPADYTRLRSDELPDPSDPSVQVNPEQQTRTQRAQERLHKALSQLAEKKRTVFVLVELEGRSREEVADIIGVNPATVRTRLFYARRDFWRSVEKDPVLAELMETPR